MFLYIVKGMIKCDFWELESTEKLLLQTKYGIMLTHVITTHFSPRECDLKWCHNLIRFNLLFYLNKVTRNAYVAFFYYLNIISVSKPIYFYIFWKVWLNLIFESWNQLKSYDGLNLKNVWMQKSFCLVISTKGDLQIQMI